MSPVIVDNSPDPHHHEWAWAEPLGLPGQIVEWCKSCGQRRPSAKERERIAFKRSELRRAQRLMAEMGEDDWSALAHRLREYAHHAHLCATHPIGGLTYSDPVSAACDCGFDAVLAEYDRLSAT